MTLSALFTVFILTCFSQAVFAQHINLEKPLPEKKCFCPPPEEIFNDLEPKTLQDNRPILLNDKDILQMEQRATKHILRKDEEVVPGSEKNQLK